MRCFLHQFLYRLIASIYCKRKYSSSKLKQFRNIHKGQRCFIMGNGPSLNTIDISKLKNEVTIGCNRIYLFNKVTPKYYCLEDELLFKQISKDLETWDAKEIIKFIPKDLAFEARKIENVCLINFVYQDYVGGSPNFSEDLSKICYWGSTVSYMMLQIAYYLGCNPIYLIGMDGVRPNRQKHFYPKDDVRENPAKYELSDAALIKAREFFDNKRIKIYNATKDPARNFFEQIDYEEIFK